MARISGVNIPLNKRVEIGLTYIYGIGRSSSNRLLAELGIEIEPGHVVGELAMLAPDNRRTATLECVEEGNVLSITYEQVEELYYQNPTFGFYFLRLATARLFDNVGRMESELGQRQAAGAGISSNL